MSWQERRCNAEGFGRPEPFFFPCEGRTYSPLPRRGSGGMPMATCAHLRAKSRLRRLRSETRLRAQPEADAAVAAPCANLPPAAFSQLWTELTVRPFSFSEKKQKQGYAVSAYPGKDVIYYGNLSFGSKGRKPRNRTLCLCCGGIYELFCHL